MALHAVYGVPHQAPARPAHTRPRPQPWGGVTPDGSQTRAGTPRPSASASEAHDPEPKPAKQAAEEGDGASPRGHARPGADTQSAEDPAPATCRTTAVDRRAKLPRPRPKRAARKTRADGTPRATRSMPDAQPVTTVAPEASWPTAHVTARRQPGDAARLPETPTTRAERRRPATAETGGGAGMAKRASGEGAPCWGDAVHRSAAEGSAKRMAGDGTSPIRGAARSHAQPGQRAGLSEHGEDGGGAVPCVTRGVPERLAASQSGRPPRRCPRHTFQPDRRTALAGKASILRYAATSSTSGSTRRHPARGLPWGGGAESASGAAASGTAPPAARRREAGRRGAGARGHARRKTRPAGGTAANRA